MTHALDTFQNLSRIMYLSHVIQLMYKSIFPLWYSLCFCSSCCHLSHLYSAIAVFLLQAVLLYNSCSCVSFTPYHLLFFHCVWASGCFVELLLLQGGDLYVSWNWRQWARLSHSLLDLLLSLDTVFARRSYYYFMTSLTKSTSWVYSSKSSCGLGLLWLLIKQCRYKQRV